jgi:AcrR family transcriptional regulator
MTETTTKTRPRGRPRSAKSQQAILATAIEIRLEQGLSSMSMDDVAKRAGVSKSTIYRWWASKELLALDALATEWTLPRPVSRLDSGSLRGDLLARLHPWLRQLNQKPYEGIIAGLLAQTQTDPEFARLTGSTSWHPAGTRHACSCSGRSTVARRRRHEP